MRVKNRHQLREREARAIAEELEKIFGEDAKRLLEDKKMERVEMRDKTELILVDGEPLLIMIDGRPFPTVKGALKMKPKKKRVVVDFGAVKAVSQGADVMAPGIVEVDDDVEKGDLVIIVDEIHRKPLAIGRALVSKDRMMGQRGKAVKSIHHVGDRIWKLQV
jgi:PUA domain protein